MFILTGKSLSKIYGFLRFIRPEIIILGVVCVYIGALVAGSEPLSLELFLGMIAMFCIGAGCLLVLLNHKVLGNYTELLIFCI